jgi:hypothetical protein
MTLGMALGMALSSGLPSSGPSGAPAASVISAWQAVLVAEWQAEFGYGLAGPWLTGSARESAAADQAAHAAITQLVSLEIRAAGVTPVVPHADYPALYPVGDEDSAMRVAITVEQDCAAAWRYLYSAASASSGTAARTTGRAQRNLVACATRATRWRLLAGVSPATVPFPGI